MAGYMAASAPRPDLILCSTATRTRQTLAPVLRALGAPEPPVSLERALYLAGDGALLERLQALPEDVWTALLIGHNDGIGTLAGALPGSGPTEALADLREKYPTGALSILRLCHSGWSELGPGTCELLSFVRPRDLDRD